MVGRYRDVDLNHELAVDVGAAEQAGDALLIAEHGHDYRPDLGARGWHGVMNYAGLPAPALDWLRGDPPASSAALLGLPGRVPSLDGAPRSGRCAVPRRRALEVRPALVDLLDSHDTARFATVAGTRDRHLVGIGLQMALPGVPMVFAGDELGLEGEWGEDARRTMPWDRPEQLGHGLARELPRPDRPAPRSSARSHAAASASRTVPPTRSPCSRDARRAPARASPRGPGTSRSGRRSALGCGGLETLYGEDATVVDGEAVLPADGPAFHVWRLEDRGPWLTSPSTTSTRSTTNGVQAVFDLSLEINDGEFLVLVGPSGLRQDDRAAHGRRPRGHLRRHGLDRRPRRQRPDAEGARHRDGLPELRALPAPVRRREHRLRPAAAQGAEERDQRPRRVGGKAARPDAVPRPQAEGALGRPAPARRDGPRDRPPAAGVPDGRAALEPRRQAPRADARRHRASPEGPAARRRSTSPTTRSRR